MTTRRRVAVHIEPQASSIGGAEAMAATLAKHLADCAFAVDLVHHHEGRSRDSFERFTGTDLSMVTPRYIPKQRLDVFDAVSSWRRWSSAVAWRAELSEGYDLFVTLTHQMPPFNHARRGVLFVLFPFLRRDDWPWSDAADRPTSWVHRHARRLYFEYEWRRRMASYSAHLSISEYTRRWTAQWWGIDTQVVYPPVDVSFPCLPKEDAIVSVGRFAPTGTKGQTELLGLAQRLLARDEGWQYWSMGALGNTAADQEYFSALTAASADHRIQLLVNLPRADLKARLAQSRILWHAPGLGAPEELHPASSEHFGIAVVEAMAAGSVPVVARRGGVSEIVEHGVSGYLCDSFEEMAAWSQLLMSERRRLREMSLAAQRRAAYFDHSQFARRFDSALHGLF